MRNRGVKTTWLVQMGPSVMQQWNSILELEFEMGSWIGEMRMGKSTINSGKRRMGTSKAIVGRNNHLTGPQEDAREP